MAIKDILFHLTPDESRAAGVEFAASLAQAHGALLTAASVALQYPLQARGSSSFAGGLEFSAVESFGQLLEENRKAARDAFERLAKSLPAEALVESVLIETLPQLVGDEFGRLARRFDLAVIAQPEPGGPDYAQDVITSALFGSGRPVFVLPPRFAQAAQLKKAMVCWDGGAPAAKALAESLPLLAAAKQVEIVCVNGDDEALGQPTGEEILRHLQRHGVASALREIASTEDEGAALLAYAAESGADFLIMGAYGHWRLRELIFGGTTQTVLAESRVPVFMAH